MTTGSLSPVVTLPTRRDEAWRYAPHRTLAELSFGPSSGAVASVPTDVVDGAPESDGLLVVVINGIVDLGRSRLERSAETTVGSRAESFGSGSAPTWPDVDTGSSSDAYVSLNVAYGVDGAVIDIGPGAHVVVPIHVVDITTPASPGSMSCTSTHIHLGAGSTATVIETRLGKGTSTGGSNVRTTVSLDDGAELEHIVLQDLPTSQVHLGRVEVHQAANTTFRSRSFNLGASYGRLEYHVTLSGPAAHADLAGLFIGTGNQVLDQQINVVHAAENCTSRQTFRGVLDDDSTGVFNGGIDVRRGADGTDASQSNDNLLLSTRAEINTQPRLEILADEVSCTHGATVGRLDDTALYYLRSRGIAAEEARRLLIRGFADHVADQVGPEHVRAWISNRRGHTDDE